MFACQRGLELGSPPVASCSVDAPLRGAGDVGQLVDVVHVVLARQHSGGSTGMYSLKWLVMSSDAGSSVNQHGAE